MTKLTLTNGSVIEGTTEEISKFLGLSPEKIAVGPYGNVLFYKSESKGLVAIKEMNEYHLRNAIAKIYREWVDTLNKLELESFLSYLTLGPTDETFLAMVGELYNRVKY